MIQFPLRNVLPLACLVAVAVAKLAAPCLGEEPPLEPSGERAVEQSPATSAAKPADGPVRKNVKLPGLVIDFRQRCVDVEGTICLDQGFLELVACTKGSKEHESIVAVAAKPMHIHTALLLLGANNGNPAMRKPVDEEQTRWMHLPPRGDPVDVFLVLKNPQGKMVERPISDFVARTEGDPHGLGGADVRDEEQDAKFPHTFLFAGSLLHADGPGPRQYLADQSGHVISISTFGDELLCLPGVYGHANGALMWQIEAAELPKIGTKVVLRLRPRRKATKNAGKAE